MSNRKVIIIGGVAGGASCAVRLRRLDEKAHIIICERGEYVSYANCGLPYYIGDTIKEKERLLVETPENLKDNFNLDVRIQNEVLEINPEEKWVKIHDLRNNNDYKESYDKLVLSPGAFPLRPPIPGINLSNIFTLRNVPDTFAIKNYINATNPKHAVVVGGGFIGSEMVENLVKLGIHVSIAEMADQVMAPLDPEMAAYVHQLLKFNNVELYLSNGVKQFIKVSENETIVELQSGKQLKTELVIFSIGVRPEIKLAQEAGLKIGERHGIKVNSHLQTSNEDIYAIGDAIEVKDFINQKSTSIPLAGPANKQGRIAADNIAGLNREYRGTQGTSIAKIFDVTIAATGNNEKLLKRFNIPYVKSYTQNSSHAGYYPGAIPLSIKLLFTPDTGKVLGAQIVGYEGVDKRIDVLATAIRNKMTVNDLQELELAYAPPFSSAKDPVNIAGFVASNILNGDMKVCYWDEIKDLDLNKSVILDVRTEEEVKLGKIPNAIYIPLGELRNRLSELPKDKEIITYCQIGQRGYYAARILMQNDFQVRNLSGGYKAYKITTEKQSNENLFEDLKIPTDDVIRATPTKAQKAQMEVPNASLEVDACGLACPGPIMKLAKTIESMNSGEILKVSATDPGFFTDVKVWAETTKNPLLKISKTKGIIDAYIKKSIPSEQLKTSIENLPDGKNIIVFSNDLDKAIATFIIANGAAAMGQEVNIFFTFWGLNLLRKNHKVKTKKKFIEKLFGKMMPRGTQKAKLSQMHMMGMGTSLIKNIMKKHNVSALDELIAAAQENGINLIA
ncbi:MAG: FAD-dependent oxidoreductase, partial [Promethearchaeota archaeon]